MIADGILHIQCSVQGKNMPYQGEVYNRPIIFLPVVADDTFVDEINV